MSEKKNTITVRSVTLGDGFPKICVPVTARSLQELEKQVKNIRTVPCDMVELRADFFEGDPIKELIALREALPYLPILFTFRTKEEGGERKITPEDYAALNRQAAGLRAMDKNPSRSEARPLADLIDLEYNRGEDFIRSLCHELQEGGVKVVMSYHDFEKTPEPDKITGLLTRMQQLGADITKTAVMPRCERDVLFLLHAALEMKERLADRPYIMMSMGTPGGITRLAGTLTGSSVTFASAGAVSAPGQMDAAFVAQARSVLAGD
ncbi:MAG: type I 3-dehydroquinate dehydratase [Lachnospiraceae bacterium]|nr:type I 3-dehydroquinate dehydratase [Lachnospiraceae bacterium]